MAIKGLSIPIVANYAATGSNVTYSNGMVAGAAVEYTASWTTSENNPLYADNKIKENDAGTFQSGELTLGTSDLTQDISKLILGLKEATFSYGESKEAKELVYDDDMKNPYLGFGVIELHQNDDVDEYRAVFLPKVQFALPENTATTKGETVEWQTPSITGTIYRSDQEDSNYKHPWMIDAWFETESDAIAYLKAKMSITESTVSTMNAKTVKKEQA